MAAVGLPFWHKKTAPARRNKNPSRRHLFRNQAFPDGVIRWHRPCEAACSIVKNIRNSSILVVEDDASLLRAIEKVLSNEGCVVTCASWAAEAMERLADPQNRFDLIITDLQMPFVKGSTILRMIAQRSRSEADRPISAAEEKATRQGSKAVIPNVPVIVLTAFGSSDLKAQCLSQDAAAFLEKPLDTTRLLTAVKSALASQRLASEQPGPT